MLLLLAQFPNNQNRCLGNQVFGFDGPCLLGISIPLHLKIVLLFSVAGHEDNWEGAGCALVRDSDEQEWIPPAHEVNDLPIRRHVTRGAAF